MSVQTQIDRISGAVSAALTALSEKVVEVPAGTKVDGLAALIAAIEAGGGGSAGSITYGTHISASDGEEIVIEHGLGQIPKFIIMFQCPTGELTHIYGTFDFMVQSDLYGGVSITKQSGITTSTTYIKSAKTAEETASKWISERGYPSDMFYMVRDNQFRTKRPTKAGIKYIWLATSVDIAGG